MNEQTIELGKRAAKLAEDKCPEFGSVPGYWLARDEWVPVGDTWDCSIHAWENDRVALDIESPLVLGFLLGLVREAHGDDTARTRWSKSRNRWECRHGYSAGKWNEKLIGYDATEAGALVDALEGAAK